MAPVVQYVSVQHNELPLAVHQVHSRDHASVQQHTPSDRGHELCCCVKYVSLTYRPQMITDTVRLRNCRQLLQFQTTAGNSRVGSRADYSGIAVSAYDDVITSCKDVAACLIHVLHQAVMT